MIFHNLSPKSSVAIIPDKRLLIFVFQKSSPKSSVGWKFPDYIDKYQSNGRVGGNSFFTDKRTLVIPGCFFLWKAKGRLKNYFWTIPKSGKVWEVKIIPRTKIHSRIQAWRFNDWWNRFFIINFTEQVDFNTFIPVIWISQK